MAKDKAFYDYKGKKIEIQIERSDRKLIMTLFGEMTTSQFQSDIEDYFHDIHDKIVENDISQVDINFKHLEVMFSTSFGIFLDWFKKVMKLEDSEKYKINLIYDKSVDWQKIMFSTVEKVFDQI